MPYSDFINASIDSASAHATRTSTQLDTLDWIAMRDGTLFIAQFCLRVLLS